MKSFILGIYKKKEISTTSVVASFKGKNQRKLESFKTQSIEIYCTLNNNLSYRSEKFIIQFSGNPIFTDSSTNFFSAFNEENIEAELQKISGVFSFCYFNITTNTCYLANDYFGLYPIFIFEDKDTFIFCNEYQPILAYSADLKTLNKKAVKEYFKYGFVLGRKTFLEKINNLPPRTLVKINKHSSVYCQYDHLQSTDKTMSENDYLDLIYTTLTQFVERYFSEAELSKSITLTGGLDSRIILGLLSEKIKTKSKFICFYLEPLNEFNDKDVLIAKILAKAFNLDLKIINGAEKTEALTENYFELNREIENEPILTGLYGGELLSGLLYENVLPKDSQFEINKRSSFNRIVPSRIQKEVVSIGKRTFHFEAMTSSFFTSIYGGTEGSWLHPWSNQLRYNTIFSDTAFLKVWFSIPESILYGDTNFIFKLYQRYFPEMMKYPTNSTLKGLNEAGFDFLTEGIEPKQVKKRKFNGSFENLKMMEGFKHIPSNYKNKLSEVDEQIIQRLTDFCFWYSYINKL